MINGNLVSTVDYIARFDDTHPWMRHDDELVMDDENWFEKKQNFSNKKEKENDIFSWFDLTFHSKEIFPWHFIARKLIWL